MRFGVFFLSQAPEGRTPQTVLDEELTQIEYAEELGFDSVWLAEHHFTNYCSVNDPLTYASHVAARTSSIRIGLAVCALPLHHPLEVAERACLVDLLSHGRLDFGIGRGFSSGEYASYNIPLEERGRRFAEAVDIILKGWTEDRFDYDGAFWTLRDVSLFPKPVQLPHPPVYVASSGSPETVSLAARNGFPIIQGVDFITPQDVSDRYSLYRQQAVEMGRVEERIDESLRASMVTQKVYVAENREMALSEPKPYALWRHRKVGELLPPPPQRPVAKLRRQMRPMRRLVTGKSAKDWDETTWEELRSYDLYGTPADCIERLRRLKAAGAENILCWFGYGGLPDDHVRRAMRLFAAEVMPVFRRDEVAAESGTPTT